MSTTVGELRLHGPEILSRKLETINGQEVLTARWAVKMSVPRLSGWWIFKSRKRRKENFLVEVVRVCDHPDKPEDKRTGLDYRTFFRVKDENRQPIYVHDVRSKGRSPFCIESDLGLLHVTGRHPTHDDLLASVEIYTMTSMLDDICGRFGFQPGIYE